jgi:hypothetical protein
MEVKTNQIWYIFTFLIEEFADLPRNPAAIGSRIGIFFFL